MDISRESAPSSSPFSFEPLRGGSVAPQDNNIAEGQPMNDPHQQSSQDSFHPLSNLQTGFGTTSQYPGQGHLHSQQPRTAVQAYRPDSTHPFSTMPPPHTAPTVYTTTRDTFKVRQSHSAGVIPFSNPHPVNHMGSMPALTGFANRHPVLPASAHEQPQIIHQREGLVVILDPASSVFWRDDANGAIISLPTRSFIPDTPFERILKDFYLRAEITSGFPATRYEQPIRSAWADCMRTVFGIKGPIRVNECIEFLAAADRTWVRDRYLGSGIYLAYMKLNGFIDPDTWIARNELNASMPPPLQGCLSVVDANPDLVTPQGDTAPVRSFKPDIVIQSLRTDDHANIDRDHYMTDVLCVMEVKKEGQQDQFADAHIQALFYAVLGASCLRTKFAVSLVGSHFRRYIVESDLQILVECAGNIPRVPLASQSLKQHLSYLLHLPSHWLSTARRFGTPDGDLSALRIFMKAMGDFAWNRMIHDDQAVVGQINMEKAHRIKMDAQSLADLARAKRKGGSAFVKDIARKGSNSSSDRSRGGGGGSRGNRGAAGSDTTSAGDQGRGDHGEDSDRGGAAGDTGGGGRRTQRSSHDHTFAHSRVALDGDRPHPLGALQDGLDAEKEHQGGEEGGGQRKSRRPPNISVRWPTTSDHPTQPLPMVETEDGDEGQTIAVDPGINKDISPLSHFAKTPPPGTSSTAGSGSEPSMSLSSAQETTISEVTEEKKAGGIGRYGIEGGDHRGDAGPHSLTSAEEFAARLYCYEDEELGFDENHSSPPKHDRSDIITMCRALEVAGVKIRVVDSATMDKILQGIE